MLPRRKLIKLAVVSRNRSHVPKSHKNAPKAEISSENLVCVNTRRCLVQLQSELKDAELSRAEAQEALESTCKSQHGAHSSMRMCQTPSQGYKHTRSQVVCTIAMSEEDCRHRCTHKGNRGLGEECG